MALSDLPLAEEREKDGRIQMGMLRLEKEWDNPADAGCDDWEKLYGVDKYTEQ